jgi:hypothetical protein
VLFPRCNRIGVISSAVLRRRPITLVSVTAVAALALLAAGCGGGGGAPGVANLGASGATTTTSTTRQSDPGPSVKGQGGQFQIAMNVGAADGPKFSACMRKHGVTNFPDPNGQGVITIHSGMGIDPSSPAFRSARTICDKLLPNGGQPTPAQRAQQQQQMLAFSTCMRAHGIKDFPDPTSGGLKIESHPGSDLNANNPTFQKAQQACQGDLPSFKGGAAAAPGTAKAGGG